MLTLLIVLGGGLALWYAGELLAELYMVALIVAAVIHLT